MNNIVLMILIAAVLILIHIALTARGSRETCRIHAALMVDAKKRARRAFSVIIPLTRRAETIVPLLNHLYAQQYEKLQIIVVIKQTAGRNAEKDLLAYRKATKAKDLKVIRYSAGMDVSKLAASQYVVELQPADRLTGRFFEVVSLILATHRPDALAIRTIALPELSFASAYQAGGVLLGSVFSAVSPRALPSTRTILRRVSAGKSAKPERLASYQFGVYQQVTTAALPKQLLICIVMGVVAYGALVAAYLLADPLLLPVMAAFLIGAYVLLMAIVFMAIRGYRCIDYLNMLLFVPIAPLYALGAIVMPRQK